MRRNNGALLSLFVVMSTKYDKQLAVMSALQYNRAPSSLHF
jgi:hypothetical protein